LPFARQLAGDSIPELALPPATFISAILVEYSDLAKKQNQA
jgi:hypothetical protein